jgi:2-keto-4-pentenoate hydratase/2-oxohepta-3-ene-1,7-dioic acid hydratase in catechol pathway
MTPWGTGRLLAVAILVAVGSLLPAPAMGQAPEGSEPTELLVRYEYQGRRAYGRVEDGVVHELPGADIFTAAVSAPTGRRYALESVRLLQPLEPELVEKVLGVALNTPQAGRSGRAPEPRWFAMFPSSLNGHEGDVEIPEEARNVTYAGGLVVIVGREGRHIPVGSAGEYVWGTTIGNDFSEISWYGERAGAAAPGRIPAKATDGWAPLGPYVARGVDYAELAVVTRLNGDVVQSGRAGDLITSVPELISNISRYVTLKPGDLIFVGTVPYREGARRVLRPGDEVEVEIQGLGVLRNRIVPMQPGPGGRP